MSFRFTVLFITRFPKRNYSIKSTKKAELHWALVVDSSFNKTNLRWNSVYSMFKIYYIHKLIKLISIYIFRSYASLPLPYTIHGSSIQLYSSFISIKFDDSLPRSNHVVVVPDTVHYRFVIVVVFFFIIISQTWFMANSCWFPFKHFLFPFSTELKSNLNSIRKNGLIAKMVLLCDDDDHGDDDLLPFKMKISKRQTRKPKKKKSFQMMYTAMTDCLCVFCIRCAIRIHVQFYDTNTCSVCCFA